MISKAWALVAWFVAGILLLFTVRRWLFTILALWLSHSNTGQAELARWFRVLLLVPIRNEAEALPELLPALDNLAYPGQELTVVLIDDGSTDDSRCVISESLANRENWHLLGLEQNIGKAGALNLALSRFPDGEIIAVYDADERPQPEALSNLVSPFRDASVGGVSGRRAVSNALASPAASYTAFEGLVHQLVTLRAKDKLNLAPAILGSNCAYRRSALAKIGNFKPGALLEDSDLTLKLARAGWQLRFEPGAVSYHRVPQTISGYWRQHTRWARGFNEVAREQAPAVIFERRLPLLLRLELLIFSVGYLDRLALMLGGVLVLLGRSKGPLAWILGASLVTPLLQIMAALKIGRESAAMWVRVIWVPVFFMLDIAMATAGLWRILVRSPKIWEERTARR